MSSQCSVSISGSGWRASFAAGVRIALIAGLVLAGATSRAASQSLDWVKPAGGLDLDQARGAGVDAAGNVYVTGVYGKSLACFFCALPATFGAGSPNETVLTSVDGTQDIFVAKYDASGALQWARSFGTGGVDEAYGIAVDRAGNSYVTGNMGGAFI